MPVSSTDFEYVRDLVSREAAIVLEPGKEYLVEQRLGPVMAKAGIAGFPELLRRLRAEPGGPLRRSVVEALTTNETSFFRDIHPFNALRDVVLPDLVEKRRTERRLAIWSAACSSGQEAYSVAMLIRDRFPELLSWDLKILGTDLSSAMVTRAREGRYTQFEVNRGLPAPALVRHFSRDGLDWRISDELRRMVEFREMNLVQTWPYMPKMDVVLLRNVLIYFAIPTRKAILAQVRGLMRPDGYLFLGGAETTMNVDPAFARQPVERTSCYRLGGAAG